jgi:hypothetical protein
MNVLLKINIALCSLFMSAISVTAQTSSMRIDIDMSGRNSAEVTETGYTQWTFGKNTTADTLRANGLVMILHPGANSTTQAMRTTWYKVGVQSPNFAKLTCDGAVCEDGDKVYSELELIIKNLAPGKHSLQTYLNVTDGYADKNIAPVKICINGKQIINGLKRTCRAFLPSEATAAYLTFDVKNEGDTVAILYSADLSDSTQIYDYMNMCINGFILDENNTARLAKNPTPADGDMHVDADNGTTVLKWSKAETAVRQNVYFGLDSISVADAGKNSELLKAESADTLYAVSGLTNLKTYYWRIDEVDADGNVWKGDVWNFRPRHLAFPGAEGYGRYACGGRGGKVVYVTNLNDNGPGSFREAITNDIGPRTVVFAVSGRIPLSSRLVCASKFVTIAGQTAPGKGICLSRAPFGLGSDCICRFIRDRIGSGETYDGMGIRGGNHSIMDHCSISWSIDEGFSCREAKNVTLQHTMIAEPLNIAGHDKYDEGAAHGFSAVFGGDIGSFHHNIMAHAKGRNPRMDGGMDGSGYYIGKLDIFNNVVYNWSGYAGCGEAHEANFVNNYYKKGPATGSSNIFFTADVNQRGSNLGTESYYFNGNALAKQDGTLVFDGTQPHGTSDQYGGKWNLVNTMPVNWTVWADAPFFPSYAKVESAQDAYKSTLSDIGCNEPFFDNHDQRIVREIKDGTYTYTGNLCKLPGVIDDENDAGGFEDYGNDARPIAFDSDLDGMPDWWESLHGTNPHSEAGDFTESNSDNNGDGYTALEEYLNWMALPHYDMLPEGTVIIDMTALTKGYDKSPTYTVVSCDYVTASTNGSSLIIKNSQKDDAIGYAVFKVTDSEGSTMERQINLHITANATGIKTTNNIKNAVCTEIYTESGILIRNGKNISADDLPAGVYVKRTIYDDKTERSEKILR